MHEGPVWAALPLSSLEPANFPDEVEGAVAGEIVEGAVGGAMESTVSTTKVEGFSKEGTTLRDHCQGLKLTSSAASLFSTREVHSGLVGYTIKRFWILIYPAQYDTLRCP